MAGDSPNVLFVLSDQHSFRHVGRRSDDDQYESVRTPSLDNLAESATRFESAYCPTPLCTPSRLSILTGREQTAAGGFSNSAVLPPELPTIPGTFSGEDYETCLIGKMHLGGNRQFVGFDHRPYGDLTGNTSHQGEPPNPLKGNPTDWKELLTKVGRTKLPESILQEQNTVIEAMSFLREHRHENPDQPWFLCTSFSRPHWPRTAPKRHFDRYWPDNVSEPKIVEDSATFDHPATNYVAEFTKAREIDDQETLRARAAYAACVDYLDEIVGGFLRQLDRSGFLDDTIIVYTSDHGELAGEHGLWDKMTWHEASCRVPLLVQLPEQRSGEISGHSIETPVSSLDLFPTLSTLAGVTMPANLDGTDLSDSIRTGSEPDTRPIFVDGFFLEEDYEYRMVRDGRYKYVKFRNAPELLFDLEADPFETNNLAENPDSDTRNVLDGLRDLVDESIDFEDVNELRERHTDLKEEHRLEVPKGHPNQYLFTDGRVIDADSTIYSPSVICEDPSLVYDDYPDSDG